MDFLLLREHIIRCSSILPPPPPLINGMISITSGRDQLCPCQCTWNLIIIFSVRFLWQKVPRRSEAMLADSCVSRLFLPQVGRMELSNQTVLLKCLVPLNSPHSERSHVKAQINSHPISCISQLLLSDVTWPLSCGGDPQVHNFSHPNGAQMQMYI